MESKKINQLATELTPALDDLTIIGDPTTGISKKITLSQMASLFTGTVEEYANLASFPLVGTADTIYIALDTNVLYRWDISTNAYVVLSPNIIASLVFNDANGFDGNIALVGSTATLTITTALTQGSVPFIGTSGSLTQDNANLFFDDTNNRLGINTNAPTTALDVFGSGIIGRINGTSTNNAFLGFASAGTNKWSVGNVQSDHRFRIYSEANTAELVSVLQTGEFGIGIANPTTKVHIDGGASALIANLDANVSIAKSISFRSDNSNRINLEVSGTESGSNAGADLFIRRYSDAGALIDTPLTITRSTGNATFSNNVGIGVTPSAWGGNISSAIEGRNGSTIAFGFSGLPVVYIGSNLFFNGSNWIYKINGTVAQYAINNNDGSHQWSTAPSGTAGNAITLTQAMTLTLTNNLLIGSTTDNGSRLQVNGSATISNDVSVNKIISVGSNAGNASLFQYNFFSGNANSRTWRTSIDNISYGDWSLQQATTQGGSTFVNRLYISPTGTASFLGPNGGNIVSWTDAVNNTGYLYIRATTAGIGADNNFTIETASTERFRIESAGLNTFVGKNAVGNFQMSCDSFGNYIFHNSTSGGYRNFVNQARGTYMLTNDAGTTGMFMSNGGSSWIVFSSDVRVKKNFEPSQGLNELLQIEPIKYHLLTDKDSDTKRLGFKAQNLLPLIPEMVTTNPMALDENGDALYTITPDYLLPVLVKSIQELEARVKQLESLINK
jgi:hypothetical protein